MSCCKKDTDICDMIDGLGKVVEEIDCNKKTDCEINKIKKEIKKIKEETDQTIKEITGKLFELIKKVDREKWVVGEYKWMPVGSKMSIGWVKVDLGEGLTLIQGSKEGTTTGSLLKHNHLIYRGWSAWMFAPTKLKLINKPDGTTGQGYMAIADKYEDSAAVTKTDSTGSDKNLAAGKFAELWQFKGVDYVKKELKKCLESSLNDSIDKCLEKISKEK